MKQRIRVESDDGKNLPMGVRFILIERDTKEVLNNGKIINKTELVLEEE